MLSYFCPPSFHYVHWDSQTYLSAHNIIFPEPSQNLSSLCFLSLQPRYVFVQNELIIVTTTLSGLDDIVEKSLTFQEAEKTSFLIHQVMTKHSSCLKPFTRSERAAGEFNRAAVPIAPSRSKHMILGIKSDCNGRYNNIAAEIYFKRRPACSNQYILIC